MNADPSIAAPTFREYGLMMLRFADRWEPVASALVFSILFLLPWISIMVPVLTFAGIFSLVYGPVAWPLALRISLFYSLPLIAVCLTALLLALAWAIIHGGSIRRFGLQRVALSACAAMTLCLVAISTLYGAVDGRSVEVLPGKIRSVGLRLESPYRDDHPDVRTVYSRGFGIESASVLHLRRVKTSRGHYSIPPALLISHDEFGSSSVLFPAASHVVKHAWRSGQSSYLVSQLVTRGTGAVAVVHFTSVALTEAQPRPPDVARALLLSIAPRLSGLVEAPGVFRENPYPPQERIAPILEGISAQQRLRGPL